MLKLQLLSQGPHSKFSLIPCWQDLSVYVLITLSLGSQCKTDETLPVSFTPPQEVTKVTLQSKNVGFKSFALLLTSYAALTVISPLWASASNCKMGLMAQSQGSKYSRGRCLVPTHMLIFIQAPPFAHRALCPFPVLLCYRQKSTILEGHTKDSELYLTA